MKVKLSWKMPSDAVTHPSAQMRFEGEAQFNDFDCFLNTLDWDALSSDPRFKAIVARPRVTIVNPIVNTIFDNVKAMAQRHGNACLHLT